MKIISPSKISGEIFTLIDEADQFVVLVSPYIKILGWHKFTNRLKNLLDRGTKLEIYVRDGQKNLDSINQLKEMGITPYLIPHLHSKLYFNEKSAISTSMNLLSSSDKNSLEIGHKSEYQKEYDEIVKYYKRYIRPHKKNISDFETTLEDELYSKLSAFHKLKIYSNFYSFDVLTENNKFSVQIMKDQNGRNTLQIQGILSRKEFEKRDFFHSEYNNLNNLGIDFIEGQDNNYDTVIGFSKCNIDSSRISNVLNLEKNLISDLITSFVQNIEAFKHDSRKS
ncbi:hypothetical protein SAMN05443144_1444 [Fodinibius roseus]|uniref:Phospholipase D-like domain-containing protein n=1 Tax=Fodinibius roseus TaxID=1194090 RepID=A0A1M5LR49_9BACT|nr:hypothetical protein [Fodinibius roseus]SHG67485.1 hypothetical protein SAMN05443144_1444 [Fodinibius roseus]